MCSGERPGRAGDTSCRGAEAAVTEVEVITEAAEAEVALEAAAPSMPGEAAPLTPTLFSAAFIRGRVEEARVRTGRGLVRYSLLYANV